MRQKNELLKSNLHSSTKCIGKLTESILMYNKTDNILQRNIKARSFNHCCSGKAILITYCECVFVALGIKYAMRISRIVQSSAVCLAVRHFSTFSHKRCDLRKKKLNTKCLFWFSLQYLSGTFFILRRMSEMWSQICIGLHVQYRLFCQILMSLEFYRQTCE
jgi:hypothetical protein